MGKDVVIKAPVARAFARAPMEFIQHHCPICNQEFNWKEFQAHAKACIESHPERIKELLNGGGDL